ncbi:hypothetical protein ACEWY4_013502 [Coilia grayii]|uniref:PGC-1 and ERR-induced regulator in muscle protein 1 n=1 Tax=Coilia grayii TaxID=363190 RepID=A0ABD1JWH6_9TELE
MDDLDHSVHIAERDWDSFYEDSEECCLVQPVLARIEDFGLSDNEEPASSSLELPTPRGTEEACLDCSPVSPANYEEGEALVIAINQTEHNILTPETEPCSSLEEETQPELYHPVPVVTGVPEKVDVLAQQEDSPVLAQSTQTPSQAEQDGVGATVPQAEETPLAEWKEKERWFVTVNDSPVQLRCHGGGTSSQKKRRKKKTSRRSALVSGWVSHLSQCEVETETVRCADNKTDVPETSEKRYPTDSDLPVNITPSTNFQNPLQHQALDLKTSDSPGQQCLCKRQEDNCRSNTLNVAQSVLNAEQCTIQSPSSEKPSGLPKNDQSIADNNDHKTACDMIWLNEMTSVHSGETEENLQGDKCKTSVNHLDPTHPTEESTRRLATFYTDGGECPSPPQEDSEAHEASLAEAFGPTRPIFAISSFWDEMEKLTINDILHLRIVNNQSSSPESGHLHESESIPDTQDSTLPDPTDNCEQESVPLDALDNTDSDYFTHLDDSKPDRSSCEFSTFSDFDEDLLQVVNTSSSTSPEPQEQPREPAQHQGFTDSPYSQSALSERDMELSRCSEPELTMLFSDNGIPLLVFSDAESSSRTLSPTGSEYNLSSLESEIVGEVCCNSALQEEGVRTLLLFPYEEPQDSSFILSGHDIMRTPSPVLSTSSLLEDSLMISFNEMIDSCEDAPLDSLFETSSSRVSLQPSSENLSVPEAYDYFFSDFDDKSISFPLKLEQQERETKTIPIFSCSRSLVRDLTFPEVEQLMEPEEAPIHVISCFNRQQSPVNMSAAPDVYLYRHGSWKSMLSLRRIRFAVKGTSWYQRARDWMSPGMLFRPIHHSSVDQGACSSLQVFHLGDPLLRKLALTQIRLQEQPDASVFKKNYFLFSLKQSDMCLVCIAFASWVLKSTNLQNGDTWKAALLANVSAISAIQYLRRYKRKRNQNEP